MPETFHTVSTGKLVTIVGTAHLIPVRELEELRTRGDAARAATAAVLHSRLEDEELETYDAWYVLLLGLEGGPGDVPLLCDVLSASDPDDLRLRGMVTDSLARIGAGALPEIRQRLVDAPEDQRLWLYASLGWVAGPEARLLLRDALRSDPALRDVVATALGTHGGTELPEQERATIRSELSAALAAAEPWQRPEVRDALHDFDARKDPERPQDEDWRLRYRMHPRLGVPLPNWAGIAAIVRSDPGMRERREPADLDTDARPEEPTPPHCECCNAPMWKSAGVLVCARTAAAMPVLLAQLLADVREVAESDDLFDALDIIEIDLELAHETTPQGSRQRREQEDEIAQLGLLSEMATWMIREGIETMSGARARLLAEAGLNASVYGDPEGVLEPPRASETRAASVGRNDPCPCGSGRKYKKCCGAVN